MVYTPDIDSEFLLEHMLRIRKSRVLDMGTGIGYLAINYKLRYPDSIVKGVDIDEEAIKIARINANNKGLDIEFILSDLFENVSGTYDMIVFNSPYLPNDGHSYDIAVIDNGVVKRYMKEVINYLSNEGIAMILVNDQTEVLDGWIKIANKKLFFEELIILAYLKV